jgi:hypothetical protein
MGLERNNVATGILIRGDGEQVARSLVTQHSTPQPQNDA